MDCVKKTGKQRGDKKKDHKNGLSNGLLKIVFSFNRL